MVAVPIADDCVGYSVLCYNGWMVYPWLSRGGYLPTGMLGDHNWRWLVHAPGPEKQRDWEFAGLHPNYSKVSRKMKPDGSWVEDVSIRKDNIPRYWCYELGESIWREMFEVYRGPQYYPETNRWEYRRKETTDLKELLLSGYPRLHLNEPSLPAFIEAHRHEMTLLERPFANLLDAYEGIDPRDAIHPNMLLREKFVTLEVWMPPNLPIPKSADSLEDFVEEVLAEKDLGFVGEFAEMDTYTFLSCDVTKPERAAKTLLKAFKAAGYTTGIEIKELVDNGRVWKLE